MLKDTNHNEFVMGKKHGIQFDLIDHLAIHTKVLKDRDWLIKSGDREYKVEKIDPFLDSKLTNWKNG